MRKISLALVLVAATVIATAWANTAWIQAAAVEPDAQDSAVEQSPKDDAPPAVTSNYPAGYIEEGPLPEGFPPPSEVGQVVEKSYPLCRTYSAEGNNAFMRCFAYLVKQKHEMTAPVIMDYKHHAAPDNAKPNADFMDVARMHFVLDKPTLDEPKTDGQVVVADMPRMRVLSIAFQGAMSDEMLAEAERQLDSELANRKDLAAAGPKRVLGYNSPMVSKDKTFWEVQIPIKSVKAKSAG